MTEILVTSTASGGPISVLGGADEQFIVVWTTLGVITGARFSPTGARLGDTFTVNGPDAPASWPVVAMTPRGFAVAWTSGPKLLLQQVAANGTKIGAPIQVNDADVDQQSPPALTRLINGALVVCWADATKEAVHGQIFQGNLSPFKDPFMINVPTGNDFASGGVIIPHGRTNYAPAVTALEVGDTGYAFVVAWRRGMAIETTSAHFRFFNPDGTPEPTRPGSGFDTDGKPLGFEHMAKFDVLCGPNTLAPIPGGGFCALRLMPGPLGGNNVLMADTYNSNGDHQLMLNLTHADGGTFSASPTIMPSPTNNLVIVWSESDEHASGNPGRTIRGMVIGGGLEPTPVITISSSPPGAQDLPRVTSVNADAGFTTAVAWLEASALKARVLQGDDLLHDA